MLFYAILPLYVFILQEILSIFVEIAYVFFENGILYYSIETINLYQEGYTERTVIS